MVVFSDPLCLVEKFILDEKLPPSWNEILTVPIVPLKYDPVSIE
jgi:hypothetical protein